MLAELVLATTLAVLTVGLHFEGLKAVSALWDRLTMLRHRQRLLAVMVGVLFLHSAEVWAWAGGLYLVAEGFGLGALAGEFSGTFHDYLYFSATNYTSLGLGDVFPRGRLRLVSGSEALVGLLMIGWSASFTYLYMRRYWADDTEARDDD